MLPTQFFDDKKKAKPVHFTKENVRKQQNESKVKTILFTFLICDMIHFHEKNIPMYFKVKHYV